MNKLLVMTITVGAIAAFNLAVQPAQARTCSMATVTAKGATQGIATRKAERRLDRYARRDLSGAHVGHESTTCQGWGTASGRPTCERSAIVCS
jgi:hypothetical protein